MPVGSAQASNFVSRRSLQQMFGKNDAAFFFKPWILNSASKSIEKLQKASIEVRPMICGSMGSQPFYVKEFGAKILPNASQIDKYGFYVPNHPGLTSQDILTITNIIKQN